MEKILLANCKVFDGKGILDEERFILIENGVIKKISKEKPFLQDDVKIFDLDGFLVCPGFIDLHGHFRDPGQEWREDISSGSKAAANGGYTTVVAMPNTDPPIDNPFLVRYVIEKGKTSGGARILPAGTVSKGREGKVMAEMGKMAEEGAVFFTDDGSPVKNSSLLQKALLYSTHLGVRIMEHPEDGDLSKGGQVNYGLCSSVSGLKGNPASSEAIDIKKCIALAEETGAPIHLTHVSTKAGIDEIRKAKESGLPVSCDVTPHHLTLDETAVVKSGFDATYKVNPPLRSNEDVEALWQAISEGLIDAIATDHAPYHMDEKDVPFQEAPFGIASLECAVAAVLNEWSKRKACSLENLLLLWTSKPAGLLPERWSNLGTIKEGAPADITVLDLNKEKAVEVEKWKSKARLTPWNGSVLKGWPVMTLRDGEVLFCDDEFIRAGD